MRLAPTGKRRGTMLLETALAAVLLAVAMAMTVKLLGWIVSERRSAERRGWAIQEVANAMEGLTALPFDRLSTVSAGETARLSRGASEVLPGARWEVEVSDDPPMKRIDVSLRWKGAGGRFEVPVRVTSWVARKRKEAGR